MVRVNYDGAIMHLEIMKTLVEISQRQKMRGVVMKAIAMHHKIKNYLEDR